MPNITDVDVFTDPVDFPGDGDAITSASVLSFAQDLANRTRYLKNVGGYCARFSLSGTGLTSGDIATLTETIDTDSRFSVVSDEIVLTSVGTYLVHLTGGIFSSSTANPLGSGTSVSMRADGSGFGSARICTRYSADLADLMTFNGTGLLVVTDIATQKISFQLPGYSGTMQVSGSAIVQRLS